MPDGIGDSLRRVSKVNNVLQQRQRRRGARVRGDGPAGREQGEAGGRQAIEVTTPTRSDGVHRAAATAMPVPPVNLPPLQREVRFEDVTFSYPDTPAPGARST